MAGPAYDPPRAAPWRRLGLVSASLGGVIAACGWGIADPLLARVAALAGAAIVLWLSEVIPPYVTSLMLIAAIPLLLGPTRPEFGIGPVLAWAAHPVMALFFGGLVLGVAAARHGLGEFVVGRALALSGNRQRRLLALVMVATALLSMWMSNVAAAAMMFGALEPHLVRGERTDPFRKALLLGVAMAANLGGMATPVGTGPNGIAIASLAPWTRITFLQWMAFALPLMAGMVALSYLLIARAHGVRGSDQPLVLHPARLSRGAIGLVVVFGLALTAWLTEPIHGVPAALIAILIAAVLFGGRWLTREDLARIDWSTLLLIAGGLVLGKLVEHSGLVERAVVGMEWGEVSLFVRAFGFVFVAALLSAVMSNTASAALLIPVALSLGPPYSMAVLIAIATAFGVPFVVSSPPNALAYGHGGLSGRDLLHVGLPILLVGSVLVAVTGSAFMRWIGLP